jgi:hypothetical protein
MLLFPVALLVTFGPGETAVADAANEAPELLIGQAQATAQRITNRLEHIQGKLGAILDGTEILEDLQPHRHLEQTANMLEDLMTQIDQVQAALKSQAASEVGA